MLEFVCLALPSWHGSYIKSTVELMKEVGKTNKVLYVDYHRTFFDLLRNPLSSESYRMLRIKKRYEKFDNVIVWYLPPILPINWISNKKIYYWLAKLNGYLISRSILKALRLFDFTNFYYINAFTPIYGLTTRKYINPISEIYYCYDEISQSEWCMKHGIWAEKELIMKVDKVIVSSTGLFKNKVLLNTNTYLLKNGVDYQAFNKEFRSSKFNDKDKIIGYIGSIDNRVNYNLLDFLIKNLKQFKFWFIGRITDKRAYNLMVYNNVTFFGSLSKVELAKKASNIHLGLIPFIKNEFTRNIYPLKINEYLALGCAVISTNFTDLEDFKDIVFISDDKHEILEKCKSQIHNNDESTIQNRNQFAKKNSWQIKASEFVNIMTK